MKRCWLTIICFMAIMSLMAQGSFPLGKLSPWLRQTVRSYQQRNHRAPSGEEDYLTMVFVLLDANVTDAQLADYQCRRYAQLDDIAIVMLPLSQLEEFSKLATVQRIEANQWPHTTMDTVPKVTNLLPIYQQTGQHQAYTGKGVVMGVMDVGFDLNHPTFSQGGICRISAFWDQLAPQEGDALPVGCEYLTPQAISDKGYATDGLIQNHGTHTAGIAAGGGHDTNFRGVAFESDICLVNNAVTSDTSLIDKADFYKYTSATDALGFKYIFDYAERQHKPCVISFREGYTPYIDQDDSLFAAFLGKMTGPGRILVASAGNESVLPTYMEKQKGVASVGAFINCNKKTAYYKFKADGPMEVHLIIYNKETKELQQTKGLSMAGMALDEEIEDVLVVDEKECTITMDRYLSAANPNDTIYELLLTAPVTMNDLAEIALVTEGEESRVEVFGSSSNALRNLPNTDARWCAAAYGHNVLAPGCFAATICVGATTHRQGYVNANGNYVKNFDTPQGQWATYSSTGPALNGLGKPDITAPGTNVISSYSSYYLEEHPTATGSFVAYSEVDGRQYPWGVNSGTSMATPVVAGTIALWLEANPSLTPDDIMGIFSRTSRQPEEMLDYPNIRYGYGEIDGYKGLLDILNLTAVKSISQHQPHRVQIGMKGQQLYLHFAEQPLLPVTISIYTVAGVLVSKTLLSSPQKETIMPLTQLASGIYAIQLTSADPLMTGSQLVRL